MVLTEEDLTIRLMNAYLLARKNERNKDSQTEFEINIERNLFDLKTEILNGSYRPSPLICFIIEDPVKREVFAPPFRDRVVSHLIFEMINPLFERTFIYDSYSCRKNKGTLEGVNRIEHHIKSCTDNYKSDAYCLSIDISGYFMNIDKAILFNIILNTFEKFRYRKYKDNLLWNDVIDFELVTNLISIFLLRNPLDNCIIIGGKKKWRGLPIEKSILLHYIEGIGLIIGDLLSQLFSNIYMNIFDNFVKRILKIKHYGRYVDDAFIIDKDKELLISLIPKIREFLLKELGLRINLKKLRIINVTYGINFLGYTIKPYRKYPRKRTIKKFNTKINQIVSDIYNNKNKTEDIKKYLHSINSYCGHFSHSRSYRIKKKAFDKEILSKYFRFYKNYNKAIINKKYYV